MGGSSSVCSSQLQRASASDKPNLQPFHAAQQPLANDLGQKCPKGEKWLHNDGLGNLMSPF